MSTDLPSGHLALPAGLETLLDLIHSFPSNFLPQATGSSPIYHVFSPLVKLSTAIELSWRDVRPALEACFGPEYDVDSNKIEAGTNGFALVGSVLSRLESLEETEFRELEVWLSRLIRATELQIKVCSRIDNRFVSYLEADAGMSQNSTNGVAYRHTAEELAAIISPSHIPDLFSHQINAVASSSSAVDYWSVVDPSLQGSVTSSQHMGLSLPTLPNQSNPHSNGTNSNGEHNPQYFPLYSNDPYPAANDRPHSEPPHFDNSPHLSRNYSSTSQLHSLNVIDPDSTTATDLEAVKAPKKYKRAVSGPNRPPQASTSSFPVRAFPPSITIDPTFWRLYRTFPISCAFPPKTFIHEVADLEDEEGIERMDLPEGATWVSGCDPLNLYNPRFVRGTKDEKEAMCPICAESVERGGEGEQKWMKLKNSSYVYHMTYYHGVNNKTLSLPFSPPTEFRTVPVEGKTKYLRKDMLEGCCHKCQSWIPMLSIKDASTVIPEIFWWKHAKSCHGDTTLPGGFTHYANDEIYSYVLRKQYVSKSSPKKNKARRKSVEVGLAKLNKEKAAEDARQLARAEGRDSGSDPGSRAKRNSKGKSILAEGSDEATGEVELPRANIGVPNGFGEGEYAYYENGFPYEDLQTLQQLTPTDQKRFIRALKGQKIEPRQGFPVIIIPGVPQPVSLTLSGVVTVGRKIIPDAAHPFIAPGPTDQRGGCPGLNMAANYGYLNITTAGELLYAQQEMFGFSADLAQVLVALTFRAMTDVTTLKMSIGLTDSRTSGPNSHVFGQVPGLFSSPSHNKYEIDGSLANTDEQFTPNHVGNVFDSTIWARKEGIAAAAGGIFNITFNRESRFQAYQNCIANNPECSCLAVGQALFYGAQCFTFLTFPSTNAAGIQEPPTYDVVRTFMGIKANRDGTFSKVPEEIPAGSTGPWFRRGTPLTTVEIVETVVASYSAHPVVFGANSGHGADTFNFSGEFVLIHIGKAVNSFVASGPQLGADVSVKTAGCLILDNIVQNVPVVADNLVNALLAPSIASLGC